MTKEKGILEVFSLLKNCEMKGSCKGGGKGKHTRKQGPNRVYEETEQRRKGECHRGGVDIREPKPRPKKVSYA